MHFQQPVQFIRLLCGDFIKLHMSGVQPVLKLAVLVQHPGHAAAHACREVVAHRTQHCHPAAGHIFASMVSHAFNHGPCAGIAYCKTLTRHTGHKGIAAGRAVQSHVADQGVFLLPDAVRGRAYRQRSAGKAFAQVVVCHTVKGDLLSMGQEGSEGLTAAALGLDMPVAFQHCAESPVCCHQMHMILVQPHVRTFSQVEIKLRRRLEVRVPGESGQVTQIHGCVVFHHQQVAAAHQFIHSARAELCHDLPHLLRNKEHKAFHVFRLALEAFAQFRILSRDTEGAGTQLADPHHPAAHGNQGRRREAELFCTQQQCHHHVMSGHQLTVCFQRNRLAQPVAAKHLMSFRQADLPGQARMMHAAHRCGTGTAFTAGNQDAAGAGLGHAAGNGTHTGGRHQLHGNLRVLVGTLQVINQFSQILDGINIMMRRRGNQGDSRGGAAGLRHAVGHLRAGQVSALAGLGALRHLDLYFFC